MVDALPADAFLSLQMNDVLHEQDARVQIAELGRIVRTLRAKRAIVYADYKVR